MGLQSSEGYLSDIISIQVMPVRIFREPIGRKKEKDMLRLEEGINEFEKQLEEQGMRINHVALSAAVDQNYYALYGLVHYSQKSSQSAA